MEAAMKEIRLPKSIKPVHYVLHYTEVDPDNARFSGTVDIDLDVKEETNFVMLNAKELCVVSSKLVQNDKEIGIPETRFIKNDERLIFLLDSSLLVGKAKLTIQFTGILNDYMEGFYRSSYMYNGEKRYMSTTQFESTSARLAFPCWDEPELKSTFDVIIDTPLDRIAISNMNVIEKKTILDTKNPYLSYHFATTPLMSTYLLAFIVGEYDSITAFTKDKVQINVYTPVGRTLEGQFALQVAVKALEFYSDFFHIPFPIPKLDLIPICDFAAGAMENWGAITFREVDVLIDSQNASQLNKERVGLVVCHEIAHMWFGDLVTMTWWTYLWLNEGFASFMEYLCLDSIFPEWHLFDTFVTDNNFSALAEDSVLSTHPIEIPVHRPEEVSQIFDSISYSKGATVIRMLYEHIGKEAFREGLSIYLNRFRYQNTTTEDLWDCLSEGSHLDIRALMDNWIKTPGYPLLTLHEDGSFSQNRYFMNPEDQDNSAKWNIPLHIKTPTGEKTCIYYYTKDNTEFTQVMEQAKKEQWFMINSNMRSMVRVLYPESHYQALGEAIRHQELTVQDEYHCLVLNDMNAFISSKKLNPAFVLTYLQTYKERLESDFDRFKHCPSQIVQVVASILHAMYKNIQEESYLPQFKAMATEILTPCYQSLGLDQLESHTLEDEKARASILNIYLLVSEDETLYKNIVQRVDDYLKDPEHIFYFYHSIFRDLHEIQTFYTIYIRSRDEEEEELTRRFRNLLKVFHESIAVSEKRRVLLSLGYTPSKKLLKEYLMMVMTEEVRRQDSYLVFASCSRNPRLGSFPWEFFLQHWEQLNDMLRTSFGLLSAIIEYSIDGIQDEAMIPVIEKFFHDKPEIVGVDMTVKKSLELIHTKAIKKQYYHECFQDYFKC